jgi:hypothetical protein
MIAVVLGLHSLWVIALTTLAAEPGGCFAGKEARRVDTPGVDPAIART